MQDSKPSAEAFADRPARGRPRDPGLEARVFDAAMEIYAAGGWPALTFDAVSRQAGVGKAGLYRRWATRSDLLRETLEARWYAVGAIDTGDLRGDLLAVAQMCFDGLSGPYGGVTLHLRADALRFKDFRETAAPYSAGQVAQGRSIVRRAITRGELSADVNPGLVMDLVVGAVTNHVASTPKRLRPNMIARKESFIVGLIDTVLRGLSAHDPT